MKGALNAVVAVAVLLLAGCAVMPGEQEVVRVRWHRVAPEDVPRECGNRLAQGCSWDSGGVCHVVAPDLGGEHLNTLGHELKHCFDGKWHL